MSYASSGEMAEWLMALVLKTGIVQKLSRVRIPLSPFVRRTTKTNLRKRKILELSSVPKKCSALGYI